VKDAIADALGTYVCRIEWPHGWRRAEWLSFRSSPKHDGRPHHARRSPSFVDALHTFHLDTRF
jgi:hypothetical protein